MKIAVMIYGPPGSGKGTQANLVADKLGLLHFNTGKYVELIVHDPESQDDPEIKKRRREFDTGKLIHPPWILKIVKGAMRKIGKAGMGVVFSGSPRTLLEARGLVPLLEKTYGRKNIYAIAIKVRAETSIKRNSTRLVCDLCNNAILGALKLCISSGTLCPVCGSRLRRRTLDTPNTIKVRLEEYTARTEPIFAFLEERGYKVYKVDGESLPEGVFRSITKILRLHDLSENK